MFRLQIDELNSTIQTYRVTIGEKDAELNELQSKLASSANDQREQELFKQIAEHKEKNNVSIVCVCGLFSLSHVFLDLYANRILEYAFFLVIGWVSFKLCIYLSVVIVFIVFVYPLLVSLWDLSFVPVTIY